MKYLLLACSDEAVDVSAAVEAAASWAADLTSRGIRLMGGRLRPAASATTVRVRHAETLVSDGPFAETKEQLGGFDVIECRDLDEAIELASRHPAAGFGSVELRPILEDQEAG